MRSFSIFPPVKVNGDGEFKKWKEKLKEDTFEDFVYSAF